MHDRNSLPDATMMIIVQLIEGEPLSISKLAEKTGLDRRTVDKAINMLLQIQAPLRSYRLEMHRVGNTCVVRFNEMAAETQRAFDSSTETSWNRREI